MKLINLKKKKNKSETALTFATSDHGHKHGELTLLKANYKK
jgi:hypothetical protein